MFGALKRRAGRFKPLLKQLLLTLESLQTPSREGAERRGGTMAAPHLPRYLVLGAHLLGLLLLQLSPARTRFSVQDSRTSWCVFIESCSEAGIVPVVL